MERKLMLPTIEAECSEFLKASNGKYIVKGLPSHYQGFAKVKVRLSKSKTDFSENFNNAFKSTRYGLHESAIFGYTNSELLHLDSNMEPFYIFPINGFKILYNPVIGDSTEDYTNMGVSNDMVSDLLRVSYTEGTLQNAMNSKCEIIFYDIPYYYALRQSIIDDYSKFISE